MSDRCGRAQDRGDVGHAGKHAGDDRGNGRMPQTGARQHDRRQESERERMPRLLTSSEFAVLAEATGPLHDPSLKPIHAELLARHVNDASRPPE